MKYITRKNVEGEIKVDLFYMTDKALFPKDN